VSGVDEETARFISDLADRQAISEVLIRYCRAVDRLDVELLASVYHPDAIDDHGGWVGDALTFVSRAKRFMTKHFEATQHRLSNVTIELDGDIAHVESYVLATHVLADNGIEVGGARYVDRFERREGEWRIAYRTVVMDWYVTGDRGAPSAHLAAFTAGRRDRSDPAYERR
jgi:ketosteroid isomerase-like protein